MQHTTALLRSSWRGHLPEPSVYKGAVLTIGCGGAGACGHEDRWGHSCSSFRFPRAVYLDHCCRIKHTTSILHACPVKRVNERRASWSATASTQSTGTLRHNMNVDSSSPRWKIFCCEKWRRPNGRFKGAFPRIRNARQPAAESSSAHVSKHRTHIAFDGERVDTGNLRGAVVKSSSRGRIPANTQCGAAGSRL